MKLLTNCVKDGELEKHKQLDCVVTFADKTEAIAGMVASQVVRGGWIGALNNEALAKAIQVSISVGSRKAAEEWAWQHNLCPPGPLPLPFVEMAILRIRLVD